MKHLFLNILGCEICQMLLIDILNYVRMLQNNVICDDTSNMSNVVLVVSPDLEFVDTVQTACVYGTCYKYITEHINSESAP